MYKTIIIEDEAPARELIRHFLKKYSNINIVAECSNGFEGYKLIKEHSPDFIFLDIKMPKISGFEMLELIETPPLVIFSTAYDEYAIRAFEENAIDYLLKPYSEERFYAAIEKVLASLLNNESMPNAQHFGRFNVINHELDRIVVKNGHHIEIVDIEDIIYVEADDDYIDIHTTKGKFKKKATLKKLVENLPTGMFLRVHRSFVVKLKAIKKIEPYTKDSYQAILNSGTSIPVSRSGYSTLKEVLDI